MAELSMTALAVAILVIGIALTVARSAAGHWKDPERADDLPQRHGIPSFLLLSQVRGLIFPRESGGDVFTFRADLRGLAAVGGPPTG